MPEGDHLARIELFIVRAIVQAHGGSIQAQEAAGGGARFAAELPLQPAAQADL